MCLTPCDPTDCSPPDSSLSGILQARTLEWVTISFSRDLPDPGIKPASLSSPALAGGFFTTGATWEAQILNKRNKIQKLYELPINYWIIFETLPYTFKRRYFQAEGMACAHLWKVNRKYLLLSCVWLCDLWTVAHQASDYGILQARTLMWVAIPFFRGFSWTRDWTWVSCIAGRFWTTREEIYWNGSELQTVNRAGL